MRFPDNLRYLRRKANLTQAALADKLGVDYNTIRNYETGRTTPRLDLISQLAGIFKVSIEDLRNNDLAGATEVAKELPTDQAKPGKVIKNPFLLPQQPARYIVYISVALDGTADSLNQAIARLTAFNDTIADTDDLTE